MRVNGENDQCHVQCCQPARVSTAGARFWSFVISLFEIWGAIGIQNTCFRINVTFGTLVGDFWDYGKILSLEGDTGPTSPKAGKNGIAQPYKKKSMGSRNLFWTKYLTVSRIWKKIWSRNRKGVQKWCPFYVPLGRRRCVRIAETSIIFLSVRVPLLM